MSFCPQHTDFSQRKTLPLSGEVSVVESDLKVNSELSVSGNDASLLNISLLRCSEVRHHFFIPFNDSCLLCSLHVSQSHSLPSPPTSFSVLVPILECSWYDYFPLIVSKNLLASRTDDNYVKCTFCWHQISAHKPLMLSLLL